MTLPQEMAAWMLYGRKKSQMEVESMTGRGSNSLLLADRAGGGFFRRFCRLLLGSESSSSSTLSESSLLSTYGFIGQQWRFQGALIVGNIPWVEHSDENVPARRETVSSRRRRQQLTMSLRFAAAHTDQGSHRPRPRLSPWRPVGSSFRILYM